MIPPTEKQLGLLVVLFTVAIVSGYIFYLTHECFSLYRAGGECEVEANEVMVIFGTLIALVGTAVGLKKP